MRFCSEDENDPEGTDAVPRHPIAACEQRLAQGYGGVELERAQNKTDMLAICTKLLRGPGIDVPHFIHRGYRWIEGTSRVLKVLGSDGM